MSHVSVTPLSLDEIRELITTGKSLWVINYTDHGRQRNRGVLQISAQDETGAPFAITVPNTWIPVNLAEYGNIAQLLKSQAFLDTIRKRDIVCISATEASALLSTPEAREEKQKVDQKYNQSLASHSTSEKITISQVSSVSTLAPEPENEDENTEGDNKLNNLVNQFNENRLTDQQAIEAFKDIEPRPTMDGIQKALMNVKFTTDAFYKYLIVASDPQNQFSDFREEPTAP